MVERRKKRKCKSFEGLEVSENRYLKFTFSSRVHGLFVSLEFPAKQDYLIFAKHFIPFEAFSHSQSLLAGQDSSLSGLRDVQQFT